MASDAEDELTVDEFLLTSPCLEEVSGFLQGLPGLPTQLTEPEHERINAYRERLLEGKIVPAPTGMPRAYTYRFGHRPTKGKK